MSIKGGLSSEEWVKAMQVSQIALVTMAEGSEEVVMPSKSYSAMMAGQAILAIAPENSDLVDLIKATNCGWWVQPGDSKKLNECLIEIRNNKDLLKEKRQNAFSYSQKYFSQRVLAKEWTNLILKLKEHKV